MVFCNLLLVQFIVLKQNFSVLLALVNIHNMEKMLARNFFQDFVVMTLLLYPVWH
jgi:hypothetical protein